MRSARDLHLLAGAVLLSSAGDMLSVIALALVVADLTGSGLAVSAYFATTMVPKVALAPLAGRLADAVESTRVLRVVAVAQAAVAVALAFSLHELWALLALATLLSAGSALAQPAEFALAPVVAGPRGLQRANGLLEAARYGGYAVGPAVAAALVAAGGAQPALLADAASFLAIAVAATLMRARRPPRRSAAGVRARDGAAALLADPLVRPAVLAGVGALLLISASMTAEVFYVKDVLHAGDAVYAALFVAWMAGMVAGAVGLAPRVPRRWLAAGALVALGVQGAGMAGQTVAVVVPAAFAGYLVGGVGHGVKNTLLRTLIGVRVPAELHGRAFAAYNAARNAAEIGALAGAGVLVAALGPRLALVVAGGGALVAALGGLAALRAAAARRGAQLSRRSTHSPTAPTAT